jgi:hypothetical protein
MRVSDSILQKLSIHIIHPIFHSHINSYCHAYSYVLSNKYANWNRHYYTNSTPWKQPHDNTNIGSYFNTNKYIYHNSNDE